MNEVIPLFLFSSEMMIQYWLQQHSHTKVVIYKTKWYILKQTIKVNGIFT